MGAPAARPRQMARILSADVDVVIVFFGLHEPDEAKWQEQMRALAQDLDDWMAADPNRIALLRCCPCRPIVPMIMLEPYGDRRDKVTLAGRTLERLLASA